MEPYEYALMVNSYLGNYTIYSEEELPDLVKVEITPLPSGWQPCTSIFCFWWLCFVGLTLGIVSVCLGNKVLGWIATGVGAAVSIAEIIFLSLS